MRCLFCAPKPMFTLMSYSKYLQVYVHNVCLSIFNYARSICELNTIVCFSTKIVYGAKQNLATAKCI